MIWTYCSDKLPEENGEYLVSAASINMIPHEYTGVFEFSIFTIGDAEKGTQTDGEWRYWESSIDDYVHVSGVYAWAPLPEPAPYKFLRRN